MKKLLIAAGALAAATIATSASAQTSANPRATANARLIKPLTLEARRDLNFGTIVMSNVTTDQTVSINRDTGVVTCGGGSGAGLTCSGAPTTAQFRVTGTERQVVVVSSAQTTYSLTGNNGGTLTFTPQIPTVALTLAAAGPANNLFTVGGSIVIGSATQDGVYRGEIDIRVDYQ